MNLESSHTEKEDPLATQLARIELKRADAAELVKQSVGLAVSPFVTALGKNADAVLRAGLALRYPARTALFEQGQPGQSVFFLLKGEVRLSILHPGAAAPSELGSIHPGEFVGETEVLSERSVRPFSAVAGRGSVEVVELTRVALASIKGELGAPLRSLFEETHAKRRSSFDELNDFLDRW